MVLKNLLIVGILSVLTMSGGKAAPYQTLISQEGRGKIELISSWCERHPRHHKCHRHHHHPPFYKFRYMYDERYATRESYCRQHPFRDGCQRFCMLNPGVCSTKGWYSK